jgi:hypothetical protein
MTDQSEAPRGGEDSPYVPAPSRPVSGIEHITDVMPLRGQVITPGPPSLETRVRSLRAADRGHLVGTVHLQARRLAPLAVKGLFAAAALTVVAVVAMGRLSPSIPLLTTPLLVAVAWLPFLGTLVVVLAKSRANGADFYQYGVEVKTGLLDRSVHFIWYYQITESPCYVRRLPDYLTRTATLGLRYNQSGESSARYVELLGIGTPGQVRQLRQYVESRIPAERIPIKGPLA